MEALSGKVAVVTGGASGIGLALARAFAGDGMKLVLADIERDALERAGAELAEVTEVELVSCDVSDAAQVDALRDATVARFGTAHVVCNNAGVGTGGLTWDVSLDDWNWVLGVNLMGVVHGIRAFTPMLIEQGEGHIVNTASMAGVTSPPFMAPYNVSKHGVVTLSETLYADLQIVGATNVGVTALCPGWVQTRIHESARNRPGADDSTEVGDAAGGLELQGAIGNLIATGLEPDHVAGLVLDAVHHQRFYVLTHPDWIAGITDRTARMVDGADPALMLPT
jgi:NAD(P)-dependent dehydrogenase (short-subunit alcohol dehydrogenase family)